MQKKLLLLITGLSILIPVLLHETNSRQTKKDFKKLSWILNSWQRTNVRPGTTASETWQKQSDYVFTGMGVSLKGSDTTFVEQLRIEIKDDKIYYVADVRENATPTYFHMTEITDHGFKSENPEHDFPKVISYNLEGDVLTAIISDGGQKKMGFVFKRTD
ncbi:MAG: hypothetical protein HEP71_26555 [Roseivirga sp.]|nr:hypothetical protein [Roseivirga sp.]